MLGGYDGDEVDNDVSAILGWFSFRPRPLMLVNLRFCLIGNYLSKIIPALQSRCTRYEIGNQMDLTKSLKVPLWTIGKGADCSKAGVRLQGRKGEEFWVSLNFTQCLLQIDIDEEGKESLMRLAQGDMRKVLNILQVGTDSVDWSAPALFTLSSVV